MSTQPLSSENIPLPAEVPVSERERLIPALVKGAAVLALLLMAPTLLQTPSGQRLLMAISIFGIFFFLILRSFAVGFSLLLVYLGLLGGIRRWLIPDFGWTGFDPLILVMPAIAALPFLSMFLKRRVPYDTPASRLIVWLMVIMVLEIFNPLQGGLAVGIAGVMFYMVPLMWFFIGRKMGTMPLLNNLLRLTVWISIAAALYGLKQNFLGMSDSEEEWLHVANYNQMVTSTQARAFSFFTSAAEYNAVMAVATTILWAMFLRGHRLALIPIPLLAVAIFLGSERGTVVGTLLGCCLVWAVQGKTYRTWTPRIVLAIILAVVGLVWSLQQLQTEKFDANTAAVVQHQEQGLLDPGHSTAVGHANEVQNGLLGSLTKPFGLGLGATTIAAGKFGGNGVATEMDFSDLFASLGPAGGCLYLALMFVVMRTCFRCWKEQRSFVFLGVIGMLGATLGHWVSGGFYLLATLTWFALGTIDRTQASPASLREKAKGIQ